MAWAFGQKVPPLTKIVLLSLANHADNRTGRCFPSIAQIADETTMGERSVVRHLGALVRNGYILRERSHDAGGHRRANTYFLVLDRISNEEWTWAGTVAAEPEAVEAAEPEENLPLSYPPSANLALRPKCQSVQSLSAIVGTCNKSVEPSVEPSASTDRSVVTDRPPKEEEIKFSKREQEAEREAIQKAASNAGARVFVYEGSTAWKAWIEHRRQQGMIPSLPVTNASVEGRARRGWYLPTLFPPKPKAKSTGPPAFVEGTLCTEQDLEDFLKTG
jgi:hypothetical protein